MGKITDKRRYVNTRFWSDAWVVGKLNPMDRYLFLYLLTNDRTNIAGVYELPLRRMSFDTGIEERDLLSMLKRMEPKVYYVDEYVILKNSSKHQDVENPKIKAGIDRILESVPSNVRDTLLSDSLSLPIDTQSHSDLDLDSDLDTKVISSNDSAKSDDLATLFDELRTTLKLSPQYKLSIKRRETLKRRLKEFSGEDIVKACQNLALDEWNMGDNPRGKKYADIDFLLRNYEQVERFLLAGGEAKSKHDLTQEEIEAIRKRQEAEVVYA